GMLRKESGWLSTLTSADRRKPRVSGREVLRRPAVGPTLTTRRGRQGLGSRAGGRRDNDPRAPAAHHAWRFFGPNRPRAPRKLVSLACSASPPARAQPGAGSARLGSRIPALGGGRTGPRRRSRSLKSTWGIAYESGLVCACGLGVARSSPSLLGRSGVRHRQRRH